MRKYSRLIILITATVVVVVAAWFLLSKLSFREPFYSSQNVLPSETKRVLDTGERFILLSLDPTHPALRGESEPPPPETFHGYAVLGKIEIRDQTERAALLEALYKGIQDSEGRLALCFNPRHGVSATLAGETVDLVICFECLQVQTYAAHGKGVLTTDLPEPTFNRALEAAGLPVAKRK